MPGAAEKLSAAIREFDSEVRSDPRFRDVLGNLLGVEHDLGRLGAPRPQEDESPGQRAARAAADERHAEKQDGEDRKATPKSFREARERARQKADAAGAGEDDSASDHSPEGRRAAAAQKEDT